MAIGEPLRSEEARKTCERAEYYMQKIRSKELRLTPAADTETVYDPLRQKRIPIRPYINDTMSDYDEENVKLAEHTIKLNLPKEKDSADLTLLGFDEKEHEQTMVNLCGRTKYYLARNFLAAVDAALTSPKPLIEEGEAFFSKLKDSEKEKNELTLDRDRLKDDLAQVSAELVSVRALYEDYKKKYEECERKRYFHEFRGTGTNTGS
jgi:hypothetical protein